MHAYIKHGTANIKRFLADGRIRVPLSSYLNYPGAGYDTSARGVGEMLQARSSPGIFIFFFSS